MRVQEAKDGDFVVPGLALVAPGGKHLVLQASGARWAVRVKDGPAPGDRFFWADCHRMDISIQGESV